MTDDHVTDDHAELRAAHRKCGTACRIAALLADRDRKTEALMEIADGLPHREPCPNPWACMTPQAHVDDESGTQFANRLQRIAVAALRGSGAAEEAGRG